MLHGLPWFCCVGCRAYVVWAAVVMLRYLAKQSQLPVLDWAKSLTIEQFIHSLLVLELVKLINEI